MFLKKFVILSNFDFCFPSESPSKLLLRVFPTRKPRGPTEGALQPAVRTNPTVASSGSTRNRQLLPPGSHMFQTYRGASSRNSKKLLAPRRPPLLQPIPWKRGVQVRFLGLRPNPTVGPPPSRQEIANFFL